MNAFEKEVARAGCDGLLCAGRVERIQVNLGLRCNLECRHCHLAASPVRREEMRWSTMETVAALAAREGAGLIDLTGGAPELHPRFREFVALLTRDGMRVMVRTNLTVLLEPGQEETPHFLREHKVALVASLPCYLEENVRAQRGEGVYQRAVEAMTRLNRLGYGLHSDLPLDLVYNPGGPVLPPSQRALEADYRRELASRFGLSFTRLLTMANMPLGRYRAELSRQGKAAAYLALLHHAFNPATLTDLMCRSQISVGWDGRLYDCDFNLALALPVMLPENGVARAAGLAGRRIVTGEHCFGCTAGVGSSCGGALVA